jgi:vacuolar-type H+-ATPase subunit I/STV1
MNQFKLLAIVYLLSAIKLWSTTKFSLNRSPLFSLRCQRFQETLDFEISSQQHFVRANLEVQSRLVLAMQKESLQRSVAQLQAMRVYYERHGARLEQRVSKLASSALPVSTVSSTKNDAIKQLSHRTQHSQDRQKQLPENADTIATARNVATTTSENIEQVKNKDPRKWDWSDLRASMSETRQLLQELLERGDYFDRKLDSWKYEVTNTFEAMQREQERQLHSALLYAQLAEVTYAAAVASLK